MMFPTLNDAHLVNGRTLSFTVPFLNGRLVLHGMVNPDGKFIYRNLLASIDGDWKIVPVYN